MPIRRPAIQHSIRRPMYPGARINTGRQRINNDIINMELGSAIEPGLRNIRKSSLKCHCRLRLKKLLRHGNWSNKETKQEINIQTSPEEAKLINNEIENDLETLESAEDASLIEESELDFLNYIVAPEINQEYLEMEIENLDNSLEYANPEFEAPGNYSNYFRMEIENPENKSDIDEETEEELQGNDVGYDFEQTIDHSHMLHTEDEHAQTFEANYENAQILKANEEAHESDPNERLNTEILENIVINNADINHAEILRTIREMIILKRGISSSTVDNIENDTALENNTNVKDQINRRDNRLQANVEIRNAEGIHNIYPKNNEPTTKNTSTETRETEKAEKAPPFDNFKVPKQVTRLKKKKVKKQQPRFVLTHVIGGHIIQESNYAFPIREPVNQKTKPQSSNTEKTTPAEVKEEIVPEESGTKEPVLTEVKDAATVVQEERVIEELVPTEVQEEEEVENVQEDVANGDSNPFTRLQQSTVKSWTVEDLSDHILKCNWGETASLLQDNEIDGATLFMVTKTQLMIIGVNEEHADVISEFVQSGPSRGN